MRLLTTCTGCGESRILVNVNVTGDQLQTFFQAHDHPTGLVTVRLIRWLGAAA
jgi:hypothetical protein